MTGDPDQSENSSAQPETSVEGSSAEVDVSSFTKVMRIGTMVKQLLEEVRSTDLDEEGRERLAKQELAGTGQLPPGMVAPGTAPAAATDDQTRDDADNRGTGNYL